MHISERHNNRTYRLTDEALYKLLKHVPLSLSSIILYSCKLGGKQVHRAMHWPSVHNTPALAGVWLWNRGSVLLYEKLAQAGSQRQRLHTALPTQLTLLTLTTDINSLHNEKQVTQKKNAGLLCKTMFLTVGLSALSTHFFDNRKVNQMINLAKDIATGPEN